jgi:hypothetical protein
MEQIEKTKASNQASGAAARAMAFDQRSNTAVAQAIGNLDLDRLSSRAAAAPSLFASKKKKSSSSRSGTPRTVNLGSEQDVLLHEQERNKQASIKDASLLNHQTT